MFFYLNILHAVVDYSTFNRYGDTGVLEVVDYFENNKIPASKIASYPHIGSYIGIDDYSEIIDRLTALVKFKAAMEE